MEDVIKVNVQTNNIIAIQKGDSTVTIHPVKMCGFIQDLGLEKHRATQLKAEKIGTDDLSYQPEKLYTEALNCILKEGWGQEGPSLPVFPLYLLRK